MADHIKKIFPATRVYVGLFFICLSIAGSIFVAPDRFRYMAEPHDVADHEQCVRYCQAVQAGDLIVPEWPKGSKAMCEEQDGTSTIEYQECYGHKQTDCHVANSTYHPHPQSEITRTSCRFPVIPVWWMPYVTFTLFAMAIFLVIQGFSPEVLLIGAACFLCVLGVLTPDEVIAGFANGGVIALAVLFPISDVITETGLLELVVNLMLGNPQSLYSALVRMMFLVALVSAFLSNTATVAMMIPIVVSWSRRLEVHPGKMLMPLSFASQLGGCLTLLGGSQCLVAKAAVPAEVYSMQFFDLFPIGMCNLIATGLVITVLAPTGLLQSTGVNRRSSDLGPPMESRTDFYTVIFLVRDRSSKLGGLLDKSIIDSGLLRLEGVSTVSMHHADGAPVDEDIEEDDTPLQANDKLEILCDENGIVGLRQHPGLSLANESDLAKLGAHRRNRFLYEATVRANSQLLQGDYDAELLRELLGGCLVAVKAPQGEEKKSIQAGAVMLLEADKRFLISRAVAWASCFSVVRRVPNSSPPRKSRPQDMWRSVTACLGMVLLITFVTLNWVELHIGGMIFLVILLFVRATTIPQLVGGLKPKILLTIVGALALGTALQKAGLVGAIAKVVTTAHGIVALTSVIYAVAVFLSMFINNSATIAILAPMLISISQAETDLALPPMIWALVYSAGSCFTTPLGYQTNLMVMPDGQYSFRDYTKFGFVVQACHLISTVAFTYLIAPHSS